MLSDTAGSPLHCLKSNLKCFSFLPLMLFLQVEVKLKISRSLFSFLSFSQRASCFSHSFVTSAPLMSVFFSILFHSLSSALNPRKEEKSFRRKEFSYNRLYILCGLIGYIPPISVSFSIHPSVVESKSLQ